MTNKERYWQAKKITLMGAIKNAVLGALKLLGGFLYHSHALVADGVHSFADLVTDIMVLFASKYGSQDADDSHPYGHQRIETAATLILALLLILAGIGIAWDALEELIRGTHDRPGWLALPIALFSIVANEILFHYTHHVGTIIRSNLVIANAWHHRSDAASSIVVSLGLFGTLFGFIYLDAIAAIIVSIMIIKMSLNYGWHSIKELVDTALDPTILSQIEQLIQEVDGVEKIHQLRSRLMGGDILIDVHILVSPYISVSEGHYIAQHVHQILLKQVTRIKDVIVHVDPEDDEIHCPSYNLPNRKTLEQQLLSLWQKDYHEIQNWTLHYLDGKITIDLICSKEITQLESLKMHIHSEIQAFQVIKQVRLLSQREVIS